jgi:hypothetical protein
MIFAGQESRDDIMRMLSTDESAFDNVIAMANVGMAFSQVCIFEDHVSAIILMSKTTIEHKLGPQIVSDSEIFLERHKKVRGATLGRLLDALEKSGIEGRDIQYLRQIVQLRNEFVHRLMEQVPLPGDWERHRFTLERFSEYTRYVIRHVNFATRVFSRIMFRHGLVAGQFGEFGALLWHPDMFDDADRSR